MKNYIVMLALIAGGCSGNKTARIESVSPSGGIQLIITGTKKTFADPWLTSFSTKGGDTASALSTEIFSKELSPEYVKFDWKRKDIVVVDFLQTDDSKRTFRIRIIGKKISVDELNASQVEDDDWETGLKVK